MHTGYQSEESIMRWGLTFGRAENADIFSKSASILKASVSKRYAKIARAFPRRYCIKHTQVILHQTHHVGAVNDNCLFGSGMSSGEGDIQITILGYNSQFVN